MTILPGAKTPQSTSTRGAQLYARFYELIKFALVGASGFVVDIGLFNLLQYGPFAPLAGKPVSAKIISVAIAMVVTWLGNRLWTFSTQRTATKLREFVGFVVVNIGGMAIAVLCLWISRYVLEYESVFADNISANGIGLILGMVFRYLAYKYLVFTGERPTFNPAA